jgi:hypothetical protein
MTSPRILHTSTYFSPSGTVLLAGGSNVLPFVNPLISMEIYNPSTGCFQVGLNMPRARCSHTTDILPGFANYILFSGGSGSAGAISVADLFNPIGGYTITFSLTGSRYAHGSAVFGSSQVVLVGGIGSTGTTSNSGDAMFSGSTSTFFSVTNNMSVPRIYHTVTRLGNTSGIALIVGGQYYATSELYYGASNVFFSLGTGGTMSAARAFHTATYLPSVNKVLVTGGCYDGWNYLNTMSLFDVATLSFTTLTSTMSTRRAWHTATLLPNGKVLIVGGNNNTIASTSCDLVDPANNYLTTPAGNLNAGRYQHTATLIPDNDTGTVLVCGGTSNSANVLNTCELYIV